MFRLAHLSDVHLGPLPPVTRRELASKRITGYINWHRKRASSMNDGILDGLIGSLHSKTPDHVAVTGDLVNLALSEEINLIRHWLEMLGPPAQISVVPGNHDTYVPGALQEVIASWKPYLTGDTQKEGSPFPYLRERDDIALIGVNTGRATLPFMATGSFRERQARELYALLDKTGRQGQFRVVMLHHPPFPRATAWNKRLVGAELFRSVVAETGAELILHGHTHIESRATIDGPDGPVPVVGVPAASHAPPARAMPGKRPGARYNLFDIEKRASGWSCAMQEYGYKPGSNLVQKIAERQLIGSDDGAPKPASQIARNAGEQL